MELARIFILPALAAAFLLCSGINAENYVSNSDSSELELIENASDAFFGDGWYGSMGLYGNQICATNPTLPFCITAMDAPVLEVPIGGGWGFIP